MKTQLIHYSDLGEMLLEACRKNTSQVALIETNRDQTSKVMTYENVLEKGLKLKNWLVKMNISSSGHCAIILSNQSNWLISACGIFWNGCVLVPIDYKLNANDQAALLLHSDAKALITETPFYEKMKKTGLLSKSMVVVLVDQNKKVDDCFNLDEIFNDSLEDIEPALKNKDDLACIVYSSGTSGDPKGCMLTHGNYLYQAHDLAKHFGIQSTDRYFSILPTNHAIDFMCGFLLPFYFGAAVVHQRTLRPEFLSYSMKEHRVSHMAVVPMLLKALKEKVESNLKSKSKIIQFYIKCMTYLNKILTKRKPSHAISSLLLRPIHQAFGGHLKALFAGGAFVDPSVARYFCDLGIPVIIGYGLTEGGTVLTVNTFENLRVDTVGQKLDSLQLQLRNTKNGVGDVFVKGPTIMKGYYKDAEKTCEVINEGWLKTGDIGLMDKEHLILLGRSKNMIVTEGGKNIYPEDVEKAFDQLTDLVQWCVFSSNYVWPKTNLLNEQLFLVVRPKKESDHDELLLKIKTMNQKLEDHKRIKGLVIWNEEFPLTASLKVKRQDLAIKLRNEDPKKILWPMNG